jgi:hypothetical protein
MIGAFVQFAIWRNEEDVWASRKQAHHLFRIEQPVAFKELVV